MVHIFCMDEKCKRAIHLDNQKYWNFKGKVKCLRCGAELEVEIKDGKLTSSRETEENSL